MKYLGVDFGLKRVGLARSEGQLASPWKVIADSSFDNLLQQLQKEASLFDKIVIGLPEGKMGKLVKRLVKLLRASGFEVVEADETLSSQIASSRMIELGIPRQKRAVNDAYSAAIILQNYLDSI
ncbi:pre-16S rRNA-processing nuclease YqgF [Candidatus Daviesbacteria bacterium]|nr:pre-16S rRNA-processing nuclease YqgF [Candidatus Daviesbacteria bacterium]